MFEHHQVHGPNGYVVWDQMHHHDKVLNEARAFDICHGMTFSLPGSNYNEYYFFGLSKQQARMMPYWLRNIDLFHHFINYFHDQGSHLLSAADKHRLFTHALSSAVLPHQEQAWLEFNSPIDRDQFFAATPLGKFKVNESIHLSRREMDCARLLLQGNRPKEIAIKLFISHRTVECHIANLKTKLNCVNQAALVKKLIRIGISTPVILASPLRVP